MPVLISRSVAETESHGESLAASARSGEVFGLSGDLGAGKTAWVRGFARGLGCRGRVHSPTFALLNEYGGGREPLFHLDLYRLNGPAEVDSAGLGEYLFRPRGISLVEWMERGCVEGAAPDPGIRWVRFRVVDEHSREITHDDPRP